MTGRRRIGATPLEGGRTRFRVWAPEASSVELAIGAGGVEMVRGARGYWELETDDAPAGTRYAYVVDGGDERPDPASRSQPDGVHGRSEVVDPAFAWTDGAWRNTSLDRHVFYELHVGTFTPGGTFESAIGRLDDLRELGATAIELMPIGQFPGDRNWGYDGVCLFAAQSSYGGPAGLKRLVDSAHGRGLAVYLDVVYNHLGPEGNYLREFGPYFTDRYATPWGDAVNLDQPGSDEVREFFVQNALYWTDECHIDGLRLDAVHAMHDQAPIPFVRELAEAVHETAARRGRVVHVIAESAANDPRVVRGREAGGFGCDAQWNDDFHHALRTALTGDRSGYYAAYGEVWQLADAYRRGYVYTGQHSVTFGRRHGAPTDGIPDSAFVVFAQNHDQIGNRMLGDRLWAETDFESLKLAAAATILSPFVPLLFMGEEWMASAPFQYFVSHGDPALARAVREGRKEEFASFEWAGEPPDPQAVTTFEDSRLDWEEAGRGRHATVRRLYGRLIELRRTLGLCEANDRPVRRVECLDGEGVILVHRRLAGGPAMLALNLSSSPQQACARTGEPALLRILDTAGQEWAGPGSTGPTRAAAGSVAELELAPRAAQLWTAPADTGKESPMGATTEGLA